MIVDKTWQGQHFVLLSYTDITHTIRTNFHDRTFLFISFVSFKII